MSHKNIIAMQFHSSKKLIKPAPMSPKMSSRKNAKIHYSALSTIMLQKNPSTNDDYTASYINYKHATQLKT